MVNNTFVGNATYTSSRGGALYADSCANVKICNNIIASNSSGAEVDTAGLVSLNVQTNDLYSNPGDDSTYIHGGTNITSAPLFADSSGGGYHIWFDSPCTDKGVNSAGSTDAQDTYTSAAHCGRQHRHRRCRTSSGWRYRPTVTAKMISQRGGQTTASVSVYDTWLKPGSSIPVNISVDVGSIISVTSAGTPVNEPSGTTSTTTVTDTAGMIAVAVQLPRNTNVNVSASVQQPCGAWASNRPKPGW